MNEVLLERDLSVWAGNVVAQIAQAEKRAEMYAIALRAKEMSETGADDIANHLLHGDDPTSKRMARNLLHICVQHGLMEQSHGRYTLTEDGERVAATAQVFVPAQGTWTIWASDDHLLGAPVVEVKPFAEPSAYDEIHGKHKDREPPRSTVPPWLRQACKRTFKTAASSLPTRLDELAQKAEIIESGASLRLEWNIGKGELRLVGTLGECDVDAELEVPERPVEELWRDLLEGAGLWNHWDEGRKALLVSFDDTSEAERQTMTKSVEIVPHIPDYGVFDRLTLELAINAATPDDAQRWAEWRLLNGIHDYATVAHYDEWSRKAAAPFEHYDVDLPKRAELARDYPLKGETPNWHLVAAEDWRL